MNIRQRKAERHKETLRKLSQEGGNKYCFDCDMRGPLYVVSDFNVLVCSGCSAVHRSFQHKVKGITMSEFSEEEIARFTLGGNDTAEKVWLNTFKGKHPRSGDVLALKDFVRDTFVDRRFCDQVAYARLVKAWEDPLAALAAATTAPPAAAAPALPPPPPAAAKAAVEPPQRETPVPAPPQQQQQQQQQPPPPPAAPAHDVFDDLFAAPVQAPAMPPPAAPASAPLPPQTQPLQHQPQKMSNLVDDLFAGAPPPMAPQQQQQQPMGGFGGPSYPPSGQMAPQQQPSGFMGNYATQGFSAGMPQQPYYPYPQQQQQQFDFSAPQPPMGFAAAPSPYGNGASYAAAAPMQPLVKQQQQQSQQQQQYPGYGAPFGGPPQQQPTPWASMGSNGSTPAQPPFAAPPQQQQHPMDLNAPPPQHAHASAANDPFKNLGDPSIFAHLGSAPRPAPPSAGVSSLQPTPSHNASGPAPSAWGQPAHAPPSQPFAWGEPTPQQQQPMGFGGSPAPASNASSSPTRSRIQVIGVTRSSQPPSDIPPMWQ